MQISTDGALAFFMGVTLKRRGLLESHRRYNIFVAMGCFVIAVGLRILCKRLFDDTVFYKEVIAPGTHVLIAGAFLVGVKWLFKAMGEMMNRITGSRFFQHLDRISIYVYISHGFFIAPVFSWLWTILGLATFVLYLFLVLIIGTSLYFVGEWTTKQMERSWYYLFG